MPPAGIEPAHVAGLQPAALTKLSYRGETCAPTRIRAGGRRARSSGGGTRTRDPGLMKPMLYQLSYTRIHAANSAPTRYVTLPVFTFVPAAGIEPATPVLSGQCSHQLSYTGKTKTKWRKSARTTRPSRAASAWRANERRERSKGGS